MEELNLVDLLLYYLKRLPIIIVVLIISAILGVFYIMKIQVPLYHGITSIVLVQKSDDTGINSSELALGEKLVSTYTEIIKSRSVLSKVIEELNLDMSVDELARDINVTSITGTTIIKIIVSNESSLDATVISNSVADAFSKEVSNIYNLENVYILDAAEEQDVPYNVNFIKQMIIIEGVTFIISVALIFVMFYFNDTIKSRKEIEQKIGLPVLGEIPVMNKSSLKSNYYSSTTKKKKENKREGE